MTNGKSRTQLNDPARRLFNETPPDGASAGSGVWNNWMYDLMTTAIKEAIQKEQQIWIDIFEKKAATSDRHARESAAQGFHHTAEQLLVLAQRDRQVAGLIRTRLEDNQEPSHE